MYISYAFWYSNTKYADTITKDDYQIHLILAQCVLMDIINSEL